MPITDQTAIRFTNEQARVWADTILTSYRTAKSMVDYWNANSISSLITNDSEEVVDGSRTDGRHVVTGANVTNIITRAMELVSDLEANGNAKLNTIVAMAVNGQAKF